jgi:predicted GIY-YIG superfamily endonuclease
VRYVYLIQSLAVPSQRYILGITSNLKERLQAHNAGGSPHTSKYRPWKLVTHVCFQDDRHAVEFERYLTRIIHDSFYCNRRDAAATSQHATMRHAGGRARPSDLRRTVQVRLRSSGLHAPVSQAPRRFRHEPS